MKFLFDLLPVILFFAAYKLALLFGSASDTFANHWLGGGIDPKQAPILLATAVAIVATFGQIGWTWLKHRRVDTMLWVSLVIVTVFGGATLFFHDPTFIKWKPTVLYWIFGGTLAISSSLFGRNLIRKMLESQLTLPDGVWLRLNLAWSAFFLVMGALNLFVAYRFSEEAWVNFKLFGVMGLMLVFVLAQGFFLSKYMEEESH